ncbi:MAG: GxxExxY protein [Armatimonadetes bacterium]|nr:GxxExxY protein [Armatimonadota bacterium]
MEKTGRSNKGYDFDDVTGRIIEATIEVHKTLGPGFQEVTYQRALGLELRARGFEFAREENVPVYYKEQQIDTRRVDFVIGNCIVEIKARKELLPEDYVQTLVYLRASGYKLALLINFGAKQVMVRRFVNERTRNVAPKGLASD